MSLIKPTPLRLDVSFVDVSSNFHVVKPYYELFDLSLSLVHYTSQIVFTYTKQKMLKGVNLMLYDQSKNLIYNMTCNNLNSMMYNSIYNGSIYPLMRDISNCQWSPPLSKPIQYLTAPPIVPANPPNTPKCFCYDSDSDDSSIDSWHDYMMHRNHYYYSHRY
jgi:hypothetical protein